MNRGHITAFIVCGLLVVRAIAYVKAPGRDALGERRWRDWAYRDATVHNALSDASQRFKKNQLVVLRVPHSTYDEVWWSAMANYYFRDQRVIVQRDDMPMFGARDWQFVAYDGRRLKKIEW